MGVGRPARPIDFHLFSDGPTETLRPLVDAAALLGLAPLHLHVGGSAAAALHHLVMADVLVVGRSDFSWAAAVVASEGQWQFTQRVGRRDDGLHSCVPGAEHVSRAAPPKPQPPPAAWRLAADNLWRDLLLVAVACLVGWVARGLAARSSATSPWPPLRKQKG